ncbi:alpha/beta hydrolase [Streptomyces sp. AM 2-1-1]|uniref:alpha/beta hydrolase n=1 Tax=Streptomyces sp. AM 2-1-1 TaxID=3028709 RepID=UPI0023BA3993|nr:alpha/beta hydrolase [Streptomyces sp. AM 2-1-1]WEH39801.1 alpha/beta hydrolase [Streptomyces sp. AM 2-1-1]
MHPRQRTHRTAALAGAALLTAVALAGCGGSPEAAPPDRESETATSPAPDPRPTGRPAALGSQKPDWKKCRAPEGGDAPGSRWRCATVQVPLDYAKPDGDTIGISLIRRQASDSRARIGSLLFNFGGPGGSGVSMLPQAASEYGKLNSRYDLVSFDPRGVAASEGVDCRSDGATEAALKRVDMTPDTPAEEAAFVEDGVDMGAGCEKNSGTVLPHLTTTNTARDMDLIRQVLGDEKLYYFGISYGTELGGTYADLFPTHVGRVVLDAVVDPTADTVGHARNQTEGFQRALENYLKDRGEDPEAGSARIARLLAKLDENPLPTDSGRMLSESLALTGIVTPLYSKDSWPVLTQALDEAENNGTGNTLLALADSYNGRDDAGHYDTMTQSQRAISCADDRARPTLDDARALLPEFRELSPVFGAFLAWDTAGWCAGWPVPGEHDTPEASAPGAAPILVIGTTGDPATPYEGAKRMADELGEGVGVMLTNRGEGHGSYGTGTCVTDRTDAYLLDGKVPADGSVCSS